VECYGLFKDHNVLFYNNITEFQHISDEIHYVNLHFHQIPKVLYWIEI